jgi:hypothetical protein
MVVQMGDVLTPNGWANQEARAEFVGMVECSMVMQFLKNGGYGMDTSNKYEVDLGNAKQRLWCNGRPQHEFLSHGKSLVSMEGKFWNGRGFTQFMSSFTYVLYIFFTHAQSGKHNAGIDVDMYIMPLFSRS